LCSSTFGNSAGSEDFAGARFDRTIEEPAGRRSEYHPLVVDTLLLLLYTVAMPLVLAAAAYGCMWGVLCVVRLIPMIGHKHRHSDWDRLNK
jgi:hypothetical protein